MIKYTLFKRVYESIIQTEGKYIGEYLLCVNSSGIADPINTPPMNVGKPIFCWTKDIAKAMLFDTKEEAKMGFSEHQVYDGINKDTPFCIYEIVEVEISDGKEVYYFQILDNNILYLDDNLCNTINNFKIGLYPSSLAGEEIKEHYKLEEAYGKYNVKILRSKEDHPKDRYLYHIINRNLRNEIQRRSVLYD